MRLRTTRGVRKSYTEEPLVFDDDDEPIAIPEDKSKDDDFEAHSDGPEAQDDDDEEEPEPSSDEDEAQLDSSSEKPSQTTKSTQPKKSRPSGAAGRMMILQNRKSLHDIPHYPLETRIVTRVYAGPLRRYARYSALRDAMYGPEYERIKVIWDLEIRWANFPVLPPGLPPDDPQGVMPSPWVARGFEAGQVRRGARWYDEWAVHASGMGVEVQSTRAVGEEEGELKKRFLPRSKDLLTVVGPWDKQEEFVLGQGGVFARGAKGNSGQSFLSRESAVQRVDGECRGDSTGHCVGAAGEEGYSVAGCGIDPV